MKKGSHLILPAAFAIILLIISACNMPAATPSAPVGTILPTEQITDTPLPTSTSEGTPTAFIPITGMDVVSLQCQFCVNEEAHAVLIMSDQVSFNVSEPATGITCAIAEEINGRRILLCRGVQETNFNLNVCADPSNCLEFPITLQDCPLIPQTGLGTRTPLITLTPLTPIFLTPRNTLIPPPSTRVPPDTRVPPQPTVATTPPSGVTPTVLPTTPVPTQSTPAPTQPPATQPPATQPPPTQPPATQPPATNPPSTSPAVTDPPITLTS